MSPSNEPRDPRGNRTQRLAIVWTAVFLAGACVTALLVLDLERSNPSSTGPPAPEGFVVPGGPANANLTAPTDPPVLLTGGRLGVDVRADVPLTSTNALAINSTGALLARWPGGALGDRFDPLGDSDAGVIYNDNGTASSPATTYPAFVTWCGWVHCRSIVTLPAEIDNASLAAAIVTYSLHVLNFEPSYWEIGNEPLLWTHFGIAWSAWNSTQDVNTTPAGFAELVRDYVTAIRAVDPTTPIIGIGGVGAGGSQSSWISDDVAVNGPNLSGVAIHVYPAGTVTSLQSPAAWFASLQSGTALPSRVNSTISLVEDACPTCDLGVFADEFGTGTMVPSGVEIGGGYLASFVSAEIVQSLSLQLPSLDYYDLQSATPGSWFTASGAPSPAYFAYLNWAQRVGSYAEPLGVESGAPGLLAAVGGASPGSLTNLILVNINSTFDFSVNLSETFHGVAASRVLEWNGSAASPVNLTWPNGEPTNISVPPMSVEIFSGLSSGPNPLPESVHREPPSPTRPTIAPTDVFWGLVTGLTTSPAAIMNGERRALVRCGGPPFGPLRSAGPRDRGG